MKIQRKLLYFYYETIFFSWPKLSAQQSRNSWYEH